MSKSAPVPAQALRRARSTATGTWQSTKRAWRQVQAAGIDLNAVARQLEDKGIDKFTPLYDKLLQAIREQKQALVK
jgi:transaldolase